MKIRIGITAAVTALAVMFSSVSAFADGGDFNDNEGSLTATVAIEDMLEEIPAKSVIVRENFSGKILFEKNSKEVLEISHLAKLMTVLLAAEKIQAGEISCEDKTIVSANANSKQGSQIWLDKGEEISVDELLKSVTIGNANDACTALAEFIASSEEEFVGLMNQKAKQIGMENTFFADCTGVSEQTVSTSEDMAKLCGELIKYDFLTPYFTTYMDSVRDGKAELVTLNRMVRTYSGIKGFKVCASKGAGECGAVCAKRNGLSVTAVILGCETSESLEQGCKKLLDMSFESFSLYTPEITEDMLEPMEISGGEEHSVKVEFEQISPVIIPRGSSENIEVIFQKEQTVYAPVEKGQKVGEIVCKMGEQVVVKADLVCAENVKKMNFKCGFLKLLYNLLGF